MVNLGGRAVPQLVSSLTDVCPCTLFPFRQEIFPHKGRIYGPLLASLVFRRGPFDAQSMFTERRHPPLSFPDLK